LMKPTTSVAAGSYAGAAVPNFDHVNLLMWANHLPVGSLEKARRIQWRNTTMLTEPGGVWSKQYFTIHFCHR
jgi:hypothetical protein